MSIMMETWTCMKNPEHQPSLHKNFRLEWNLELGG